MILHLRNSKMSFNDLFIDSLRNDIFLTIIYILQISKNIIKKT